MTDSNQARLRRFFQPGLNLLSNLDLESHSTSRSSRRLNLLRAMFVTLAVFSVTSPALAEDSLTVVTSGQGSLAATAYIASQLGYFKAQGLEVSILDGGGGSNAVNTLVSGSAQIALVGIKLASQAVEKGQALKVVGSAIRGFPNYVVVSRDWFLQSGLKQNSPLAAKAAALRHKTIAVNDIGGSSGEFARYVLTTADIPATEVTIINMASTAARLAALKRHRIDAIVGGDPEPEQAAADGYGVTLINPATDLPAVNHVAYMVQVVRADYLSAHPDIVARYLRAIWQSEQQVASHPNQAKQAFFAFLDKQTHGSQLDPKVADASWQSLLANIPLTLRVDSADVSAARQFFAVSPKVTDAAFIDNTLADKVLAGH